jgi:hypothetical protein
MQVHHRLPGSSAIVDADVEAVRNCAPPFKKWRPGEIGKPSMMAKAWVVDVRITLSIYSALFS